MKKFEWTFLFEEMRHVWTESVDHSATFYIGTGNYITCLFINNVWWGLSCLLAWIGWWCSFLLWSHSQLRNSSSTSCCISCFHMLHATIWHWLEFMMLLEYHGCNRWRDWIYMWFVAVLPGAIVDGLESYIILAAHRSYRSIASMSA